MPESNEAPGIGHNQPPQTSGQGVAAAAAQQAPAVRTEEIKQRIEALVAKARVWLDGEEITSQEQSDQIAILQKDIRAAQSAAEALRVELVTPLNREKDKIQATFNALKGVCDTAIKTAGKANAPWLERVERKKREAEEQARLKVEEEQRKADELAAAADSENIDEQLAAKQQQQVAKAARKDYTAAKNDKASAGGGDGRRAVSNRTTYSAEVESLSVAMRHYWALPEYRHNFQNLILAIATTELRKADRPSSIPGIRIIETKTAV